MSVPIARLMFTWHAIRTSFLTMLIYCEGDSMEKNYSVCFSNWKTWPALSHIISYHIISYHIISYHIISYNVISWDFACPFLYSTIFTSLSPWLFLKLYSSLLLSSPPHFTYFTYLSNGPNLESFQQLTVWLLIYEFEIHFTERACVIFLLLVSILSSKMEVNAERRR